MQYVWELFPSSQKHLYWMIFTSLFCLPGVLLVFLAELWM